MPNVSAEASDGNTLLRIDSMESTQEWLSRIPLTNPGFAQHKLRTQLQLLNESGTPQHERLAVIEGLREVIGFVRGELGKKYSGKLLPLGQTEKSHWEHVIALLQAVVETYRGCIPRPADTAEKVVDAALALQRCLSYTGQIIEEYCRAYMEVPADLWRQLHGLYAEAERYGAAGLPVVDQENRSVETTDCASAYAHALLFYRANPYRLSPRQMAWVSQWLNKWASTRVKVLKDRPVLSEVAVLTTDLAGETGVFAAQSGEGLSEPRYLATEKFSQSVRKRIRFLRKGGDPAEVGLGEECTGASCEKLLGDLYQQWFEAKAPRSFSRRSGVPEAQICLGATAIHYYLSGEEAFAPPGQKKRALSPKETEEMRMFGRVSEDTKKQTAADLGFSLERWEIQDESALGFGLLKKQQGGAGLRQGLLLGIKPAGVSQFALAQVKWIKQTANELEVGVGLLPGIPVPVAVRQGGSPSEPYSQGFFMQPLPRIQEVPYLVLPAGWYGQGKPVEIWTGDSRTVKLSALLEKGADFERVAAT